MKRFSVLVAAVTLIAAAALAVGDQGPNMLGFYFDTDGGPAPVIGSPWPCEQVTPTSAVSWSTLKGLFD